jgi:hypothetical protein
MKRAICLLAYGFTTLANTVRADDWHARANYPARVAAITFDSYTLDATHSVSFGSWSISFDPQGPPVMESFGGGAYYATVNLGGPNGQILPLVCNNAVTGQRRCTLNFNPNQNICELGVDPGLRLPIPCPTDIAFQH